MMENKTIFSFIYTKKKVALKLFTDLSSYFNLILEDNISFP